MSAAEIGVVWSAWLFATSWWWMMGLTDDRLETEEAQTISVFLWWLLSGLVLLNVTVWTLL